MFGSSERVESSVSFVVLSYEGPRKIGKANAHTHTHTPPHPPPPPIMTILHVIITFPL